MSVTLPKSFRDTFARLRKRLHTMYLVEWGLLAVGVLLLSLLLFTALDRFLYLPDWLRPLFCLIGFTGLIAVGPYRYFKKAYFKSSDLSLAQLIKQTRKRLGDRIHGALEIAQHPEGVESSELMHAALEQIGVQASQLELKTVLPKLKNTLYAFLIGGLVLIGIAGFCLAPKQVSNASQRFFFPIAEIPRYSTIRFAKSPDVHYVVVDQPSDLVIKLNEKSLNGQEIYAEGKLSGRPVQKLLYRDGFHFSLPAMEKRQTFTVQAGDAYKSIEIIPKPRPRISSLRLKQSLPSYLQLRDRTIHPKGARVEVLEGSEITLELLATNELQQVTATTPFSFEFADSKAWSEQVALTDSVEAKFSITDRYGLSSFPDKTLLLDVASDRPPNVNLLHVEREFTLLPHETADLHLSAEDDYGIQSMGLVLQSLNRSSYQINSMVKNGAPDAKILKASFALNPEVLGIIPDSYSLYADASDYLPEREPSLSTPITLHLLSYEAHANLIKAQFAALLDNLDEFYLAELSNHHGNQRTERLFSHSALTYDLGERIHHSVKNERKALSRFNAISSKALELMEDALRNPKLERSAQLTLTLLSQKLSMDFPSKLSDIVGSYEQAAENRFSFRARQNYFTVGLREQEGFLEELKALIDEMREFDRRFEASSFIHRLRSLAKNQSTRAKELLREYEQVVGELSRELDPALQQVNIENTRLQETDSQTLRWIEDDLRNYAAYAEKPEFETLADEIKSSSAYEEMRQAQNLLGDNHRYLAVVMTQKWAKKIQEWAEGLTATMAGQAGGGSGGGSGGGAQEEDAEFMFRIMEIIREQQNLRGKTRALEQQKELKGFSEIDQSL